MSSNFFLSYLHEVASSLANWHEDNYDFYQFDPQSKREPQRSWKSPIINYLSRRGIERAAASSTRLIAAIQLVEIHLDRFEWLYNHLVDDESRDTLVKVLAFRALGYRKVKLPLNTPAYWVELKQMQQSVILSDFIALNFKNWKLYLMDLNAISVPVKCYVTPSSAYHQFVLEQYRCKSVVVDIAVEPGDYVIDAGACWGDTSLYFANRAKLDGRVLSYEFVPKNLEILRRNLALNPDLLNLIQVVERAAWDESNLTITVQGDGPASRVSVGKSNSPGTGPLTLSIDDLVKQQNLPRVDFIKMDIEGAELPALHGARLTLQRYQPKLAISVYHRLTDFFEIPEFIDSLSCGYRFFLRHCTIHAGETVLFADAKPG